MAPSNLQGLNLIHPESPPSNLTDAQDLLSTPIFADFASNDLDLWSTINFASDEPFVSAKDRQLKASGAAKTSADNKEVAGVTAASAGQEPQFDFARFLADFALDANANPEAALLPGVPGVVPNLSQANFAVPPAVAPTPTPAPTPAARSTVSTPAPETAPAPKRARTTKTPAPAASTSSDASFPNPEPDTSTPLTPAEDKRRRNTAASARFRLKKKEREAALDARAQSLEDRVTELERECESLRRENGWLRGLVVGVTGGVVPAMNDAPILPPATASSSSSSSGSTPAQAGAAEKRKRDDEAT